MELILDEKLCTGCGNCAIACPLNFPLHFDIKKELRIENGKIKISKELCNGCGVCVESCSFNALAIKLFEPVEYEKTEDIFESLEGMKGVFKETKPEVVPTLLRIFENALRLFSTGMLRRMLEEEIKVDEIGSFIDDFKRKGSVFGILNDRIIERDLCSLCGACILCPEKAVRIIEFTPKLVKECMNCATCYIVCPKTNLFRQVKVTHERIFSARSAKKDVLAATKQGGVATSLLIYALDNDIIDCAIMMVDYNPILATKPEEIMKAKGIKFGISPNLSLLSEAIEMGYNKIALVGVPCNVIAARNLQFMGLRELKVILGIFCPRGSHPKKKTKACKFCKDLTAESSDVSIGSLGSQKGWRTVIVRTEVGEKLVKGAILQNYIQIKDIDEEGLDKIVKMSKKKKEAGNKEGEE